MPHLRDYLREVLLVANPISGGGRAGVYLDVAADRLRRRGSNVHVVRTTGRGDALEAARGFRGGLLLAVGGDGTINELLNGMRLEDCALAVVPAGTGNVFAKELGLLALDPLKALRRIESGRLVRLDLGLCNGRRFACMFGAGFDAHVVDLIHRRRGRRLTQFHYAAPAVRAILKLEQWDIRVTVDGAPFARAADQVCAGNTRSYGGPLSLTSAASPTDGLLDVMATRFGFLLDAVSPCLATLLHSTHGCPAVRYGRGVRVEVTSSRRDAPWQVDGDFAGYLPATIELEPGRVTAVAAADARLGAAVARA